MIKNQIIKNIQKQMKPILNQNQYLNLTQTLKKRTNTFTNNTRKQQPTIKQRNTTRTIPISKNSRRMLKKNKENSTSTTNQHNNHNQKKNENQKVS